MHQSPSGYGASLPNWLPRVRVPPGAPNEWAVNSVVRVSRLHREGRGFESLTAYQVERLVTAKLKNG